MNIIYWRLVSNIIFELWKETLICTIILCYNEHIILRLFILFYFFKFNINVFINLIHLSKRLICRVRQIVLHRIHILLWILGVNQKQFLIIPILLTIRKKYIVTVVTHYSIITDSFRLEISKPNIVVLTKL